MLRFGLFLVLLGLFGASCSAPPVPQATLIPTSATNSALAAPLPPTVTQVASAPAASTAIVPPTVAVTTATAAPTGTTAPTETATAAATATLAQTAAVTGTGTITTVVSALSPSITPQTTATLTLTTTGTTTLTAQVTPTGTVAVSGTITATNGLTVTATATRRPAPPPTANTAPKGPETLTSYISGQRVTALYVGPDGSIYYGVAPSDESLQFPLKPVFQLWKLPPGGAPMPLTPATMRMIGGVLAHNGTIYFSEAGALRRMPDNKGVQEGEVVIHFPMIAGNVNLPYGHMNHALAVSSVNGKEVLLMAVGSLLDSSFPAAGVPADIQEPYYEDFPTGRILYANFDWLENQHEYVATHGIDGQFDEYARGFRNPWGMDEVVIGGQPHLLAIDNDPSFTPEKYDNNPDNAGEELNDVQFHTQYGHPYFYGGSQPVVNFPDGSVPSGVAVAAGKVFVGLHNASMVVKVDMAKRTWKPVLEGISPFSMFGAGNLLYIGDFDGIHVIDASGL